MSEYEHRLRYLMKYIGYDSNTVDSVCESMQGKVDDEVLSTLCVINDYKYFSYPDGYLVHGLDVLS